MKLTWFKKEGWMYLPVHLAGMLVTLAAIAFIVTVCMSIFKTDQATGDGFFKVFVYASSTIFWWKWIAEKTSE